MDLFNTQLKRIPFIRILIPFSGGIILYQNIKLAGFFIFFLLIIAFAVTIGSSIIKKITRKYSYQWITGILFNLLFILMGYLISDLQRYKTVGLEYVNPDSAAMICIYEAPVEKLNSYKSIVEVIAVQKENQWVNSSGKAILYFEKDSVVAALQIGDVIKIQGGLNDPEPPKNPNEFDYSEYLIRHYITKQAYIPSTNWEFQYSSNRFSIRAFFHSIREYLLNAYKENGISGDEYAIASALTLGYKDVLDRELAKSYSSAGAMHVLAVSGLHVGIIYLILSYLFLFLNRKRLSRIIRATIILVILWCYAMVTGLSPSVLRATTMFSFIVVAEVMNRKTNIYNTLAASALCLLLYDPNMISEVGFQLSYLAVLSIVYFQPRFYKLIYVKNKILDKIWALFTVSIAAQIGTAPISIYYFNQFPNLFFITNLIVIPLATIILCLGMAVLFFSFVPAVSSFLANFLAWSIKALNYSVVTIEQIPYSTTTGMYLNEYGVIGIYLFILIVTLFFVNRKIVFLKYALGLIIILIFFSSFNVLKNIGRKEIVIYHCQGNSVYNFIDNNSNYVITDVRDQKELNYCAKNNWIVKGLKEEKILEMSTIKGEHTYPNLYINSGFISFSGITFFVLSPEVEFGNDTIDRQQSVDYVLFRGDPIMSVDRLRSKIEFDQIIFDSSNSYWYSNEKKVELDSLGIKYYDVKESGAFVLELNRTRR